MVLNNIGSTLNEHAALHFIEYAYTHYQACFTEQLLGWGGSASILLLLLQVRK